jgi:putative oxidoreductase
LDKAFLYIQTKKYANIRGEFMNLIQSLVAFLGRVLLSIIFIASGIHQVLYWQNTEQYFTQGLTHWLAISVGDATLQSAIEFGLAHAFLLLLLGVIFEIIGGLLIFLGLWVRLGSLLLIIFLIPTTIAFHHFWQLQGADREMQMIHFMKNVSILGGLLVVLALGKGRKSETSHVQED